MADINPVFVCSKCELATFPSLHALRSHLEFEHSRSKHKPRSRVRVFNGFSYDEPSRNLQQQVPSPHPHVESLNAQYLQENMLRAYEEENITGLPNHVPVLYNYDNIDDVGDRKYDQNSKLYQDLNQDNSSKNISFNIGSQQKTAKELEESIEHIDLLSNMKSQDSHLDGAVTALSNRVINERINRQAAADSLFNAQEILHDIEVAAEKKLQQQQEMIEFLSQELKIKEERLTTVTEQMEHLSGEQAENLQKFNETRKKLELDNEILSKSMMEKEEEMKRLNDKIEAARLTFLKGTNQQSQNTSTGSKDISEEQNSCAGENSHFSDMKQDKEVNISKISFKEEEHHESDLKSNGGEFLTKPWQNDKEKKSKDDDGEEVEKIKAKSKQLEKDREHLLLDMQNLLTAAETDNKRLQQELQNQGDKVNHLHSDLEKCRKEQTELLGETNALYGQTNLYFSVLKNLLTERDKQLAVVSGLLESAKDQQAMEMKTKQGKLNASSNMREKKVNNNAPRDTTKKKEYDSSSDSREEINALQAQLIKQYKHKEKMEQEILYKWKEESEKHEQTLTTLKETILKKEGKLKKYRQEWKSLQSYLRNTAEKETEARAKLETFISHLLDRASRAEAELSALKKAMAEQQDRPDFRKTESPQGDKTENARKGLDVQELPGLNQTPPSNHQGQERKQTREEAKSQHKVPQEKQRSSSVRSVRSKDSRRSLSPMSSSASSEVAMRPTTVPNQSSAPTAHHTAKKSQRHQDQPSRSHSYKQPHREKRYTRPSSSQEEQEDYPESVSDTGDAKGRMSSWREYPERYSERYSSHSSVHREPQQWSPRQRDSPHSYKQPSKHKTSSYPPRVSYAPSQLSTTPDYEPVTLTDKYGKPLFYNTSDVEGMIDNVVTRKLEKQKKRALSIDENGIMWATDSSLKGDNYFNYPFDNTGKDMMKPESKLKEEDKIDYPKVTKAAMTSLHEDPVPLGEKIGKLLTSINSEPLSSTARQNYNNNKVAGRSELPQRFSTANPLKRSNITTQGKPALHTTVPARPESPIIKSTVVKNNQSVFSEKVVLNDDPGRNIEVDDMDGPLLKARAVREKVKHLQEMVDERSKQNAKNVSAEKNNPTSESKYQFPETRTDKNTFGGPPDYRASSQINNNVEKDQPTSTNFVKSPEGLEARAEKNAFSAPPDYKSNNQTHQVSIVTKDQPTSSDFKKAPDNIVESQSPPASIVRANLQRFERQAQGNSGRTQNNTIPVYNEPIKSENASSKSVSTVRANLERFEKLSKEYSSDKNPSDWSGSEKSEKDGRPVSKVKANRERFEKFSRKNSESDKYPSDWSESERSEKDNIPFSKVKENRQRFEKLSVSGNMSERDESPVPISVSSEPEISEKTDSHHDNLEMTRNSSPKPIVGEYASNLVSQELQNALITVAVEESKHQLLLQDQIETAEYDATYNSNPSASTEFSHSDDESLPTIKDFASGWDRQKSSSRQLSVSVDQPELQVEGSRMNGTQHGAAVPSFGAREDISEDEKTHGFSESESAEESVIQDLPFQSNNHVTLTLSEAPEHMEVQSSVPPRHETVSVGTEPERRESVSVATDMDTDLDMMQQSTDMATDTEPETRNVGPTAKKAKPAKAKVLIKHRHMAKKVRSNPARKLQSQESISSSADELDDAQRAKKRALRRMRRVLLHVFAYLDTNTLLRVSEVCKEWCRASRNPALWRKIVLKDKQISSKFLITLSERCSQTKSLTLRGLRGRGILPEEEPEEYAENIRGCLEQGLEKIMAACQNTITNLCIEDCDNILTDKCLWLISGYCRLLTHLTYHSALDPVTGQLLWALGGGCPGVTSLWIQPLHPRSETNTLNNHCLLLIGQFYADLREIGLGGKQFDMAGLLPLVQACQRISCLHLEHCMDFTEDVASALCRTGLKHLERLEVWGTSVDAKALEILKGSCRQLKLIHIKMRLEDCVDDLTKKKEREKYRKMVKALEDLKPKFGNTLKLEAVPLDEKESTGFFSFFSK